MPDYATWPTIKVKVKTALLDGGNPRIPNPRAALSQRQLIEELVEHDDVYGLARDISIVGFEPLESVLALRESGTIRIVEGNRRLAALKLLDDPALAPASFVGRFEKLAAQQSVLVSEIRGVVAPSRDDAAPLILRKHTREQVSKWSRLMQARFYKNLAQSGTRPEDLARRSAFSVGEILSFLRLDALYEIARTLDLPEEIQKNVLDPRAFNASVLERFSQMPEARAFMRLDFDNKGGFSVNAEPESFRRAYGRVITDIATGKLDTRALNTTSDLRRYLDEEMAGRQPAESARRHTMEELAGEPSAASHPIADAPKKEPKKPKPLPARLKCDIDNPRAKEILKEVKAVSRAGHLNAEALLFRVLLELGTTSYANRTPAVRTALAEWMRQQKKKPNWAPSLQQVLQAILGTMGHDLPPRAHKAIEKSVSDDHSILSIDALNGFFHSEFEWPTERDINRLWVAFEPIFELVLRDASS